MLFKQNPLNFSKKRYDNTVKVMLPNDSHNKARKSIIVITRKIINLFHAI